MDGRITDIHCPQCGAPADFDIIRQMYLCSHCGGQVEIGAAVKEFRGFRKIRADHLEKSVKSFRLFRASCSGCGAEIVFEKNEASSDCAFCGRKLVRTEYLSAENMPEGVIPFAVTEDEAKQLLKQWCQDNKGKKEARLLLKKTDALKGFYLPYEMVRGPVHMRVSRMDGLRDYVCEGYIRDEFVNRSAQLDNLLLDGMEPFDTDSLTLFDFGYTAGHRIKISDVAERDLEKRVSAETAKTYTPAVRKVLESKAVDVQTDVHGALRLPVLLPVYYAADGELMAAVNGQTGKVSVRALKDSHYYFLPWWLKAAAATVIFTLTVFGALRLFGMDEAGALLIAGALALFFIIVTLCLYSDTVHNKFAVVSGRKIFTSGGNMFRREFGNLVLRDEILERRTQPPVFFERINGEEKPVILKFATPGRVIRMVLLSAAVLFLPVIIALFLNGFNFKMLNLGGSAVWFCIFVPVIPIYLLKFGIVELHDNPWIYVLNEGGKPKRFRRKKEPADVRNILRTIFRIAIIPPASLAFWFAVLSFCTMCWLTAFGF
ncbi:MAG: zinc ribbon domain-containing protein [Solobacterium sp.]|nr:zinc ribbon domain-containing protein [Solobacterium sp.]